MKFLWRFNQQKLSLKFIDYILPSAHIFYSLILDKRMNDIDFIYMYYTYELLKFVEHTPHTQTISFRLKHFRNKILYIRFMFSLFKMIQFHEMWIISPNGKIYLCVDNDRSLLSAN